MKKIVYLCAILIILIGCTPKQNTPQTVEGKIIGVSIFTNTELKQVVASATIQDDDGANYETSISTIDAEKMFKAIESNFQSMTPTYVRLEKGTDKYFAYSIKETAVMDYDHGTPPCYIFQSDKKIIGYYKK